MYSFTSVMAYAIGRFDKFFSCPMSGGIERQGKLPTSTTHHSSTALPGYTTTTKTGRRSLPIPRRINSCFLWFSLARAEPWAWFLDGGLDWWVGGRGRGSGGGEGLWE